MNDKLIPSIKHYIWNYSTVNHIRTYNFITLYYENTCYVSFAIELLFSFPGILSSQEYVNDQNKSIVNYQMN